MSGFNKEKLVKQQFKQSKVFHVKQTILTT